MKGKTEHKAQAFDDTVPSPATHLARGVAQDYKKIEEPTAGDMHRLIGRVRPKDPVATPLASAKRD